MLDKLWDDVVAGPRPETGLEKLRKATTARPLVINKAARRRQRVAQRLPPGEQPGHQGHGRQPLRPAAAQLPHRLRLALQRRDQEQPPLDRARWMDSEEAMFAGPCGYLKRTHALL
ncbi:dormancy associated1 [Zea mays]|uniref:Dormancy associated1 n=1 Tax=Zea mays TaxID=4577 RepID=A0A1D6KQJ6_MAIZE|nr:dormancy associated1 [Zea mays]